MNPVHSKAERKRGKSGRQTSTTWATDSEWDTSLPDPWILTVFANDAKGSVVFLRDDIPADTQQRLEREAERIGVLVNYIKRDDSTDLAKLVGIPNKSRLLMFFSPKDIEYTFGWTKFEKAITDEKVRQRNNISGKVGDIYIKDLCGWAGKESLLKFATGLGVDMPDKSSMDEFKAKMWEGLLAKPEEFLRYSVDDAVTLLKVQRAFVELFRSAQVEYLGMSGDDLWTFEDIPMTTGSLVAHTFEKWLHAQAGDMRDVLKFCLRRLGILSGGHPRYEESWAAYRSCRERFTTVDELRAGLDQEDDDIRAVMRGGFSFTALESCGIHWFASRATTETQVFNALVQGGRCCNELPTEYRAEHGLDIDISGCYAESLRSLTFPVGLPSVWSYTANQQRPTLGTWLDRHEGELLDGLWVATVSGHLPFQQDLIFSKLADAPDIRRAVGKWWEDGSDIDADFVLLREEIVNGVITSDVLKALRAVATNAEWAAIRALKVVTATAYLAKHRKADVREWADTVLADSGEIRGGRNGSTTDTRTRAWYGVDLESYVGKLVDRRKAVKREAKTADNPEDRARAAGMDRTLKLLINTLYGTFASRFFDIGNVMIGNVITARARVGSWQIAKALGTRQSITDGGIYTPDRVCSFSPNRRPGLDTLSRQWEWAAPNYGRRYVPLAGRKWAENWHEMPPQDALDELALHHVNGFWAPYGLRLQFAVEHKVENTFTAAAWWSKADYALLRSDGKVKHWMRGKNRNKRTDQKLHPSYELLDHIIGGDDTFPADMEYTRGGIMKIGKFNQVQESNGYAKLKQLRPGDSLPIETFKARYNNNYFPLMDADDYMRRKNRKKRNRNKDVMWFERFGGGGIGAVHRAMAADKLR